MKDTRLEPRLQKQFNYGTSGTDLIHGELKNLMYETEQKLNLEVSPRQRRYWEGKLDALQHLYILTYQIAFAKSERKEKECCEHEYESGCSCCMGDCETCCG